MINGTTKKDFLIVLAAVAVVLVIVILSSTTFFARPLRLYDYGPPLAAGIVTLAVMIRDSLKRG